MCHHRPRPPPCWASSPHQRAEDRGGGSALRTPSLCSLGGTRKMQGQQNPTPGGSSIPALCFCGEAPRLSKGPGSSTSHETPIHPTLRALESFQGRDDGEGDGEGSQPNSSRIPWTPPLPQPSLTAKVSTDEVVDFRRARPRPRPPWDPPRGRLRPGKLLLRPCGQGERGVTAPGGPVGPPCQGSRRALPPSHPTTCTAFPYLLQAQPREGTWPQGGSQGEESPQNWGKRGRPIPA